MAPATAALPSTMLSLHELSFDQLRMRLVADGLRPAHALALWRALYRDLDEDLRSRRDFLPPLRRWVEAHIGNDVTSETPTVTTNLPSEDGVTHKLLLRLDDGQEVETVIIGYPGRTTACLSTQAGCAMGCVFCATGQMGFSRHLRPGEIVAQVIQAERHLRSRGEPGLRNLVLMGMGEPLHNYDGVMHALGIISDRGGLNLGPARISISTVGVVPGILRMAEERQPYNLAVSLHAATDAERTALVPMNQRWPLADLLGACRQYTTRTGRRIFFAWTLIEGRNDSSEHARQVADLLSGLNAHLNLIRLNPTRGFDGRTAGAEAAAAFQALIQAAGIPCTIRQFRGLDVAAGCGQLKATRSRQALRVS